MISRKINRNAFENQLLNKSTTKYYVLKQNLLQLLNIPNEVLDLGSYFIFTAFHLISLVILFEWNHVTKPCIKQKDTEVVVHYIILF